MNTRQFQKILSSLPAIVALGIGLLLLANGKVPAQSFQSRELNIKAAFLFNFTQFVEWPSTAFQHSASPLVIGILGEDPFGSVIDETVSGEKLNGHPIIIERYQTIKDLKQCHILYMSEEDGSKIKEVIAAMPNHHALTVGSHFNFTKSGGIIRFLTLNNKIKLQINLAAAKEAKINISSKLLRLADIVVATGQE